MPAPDLATLLDIETQVEDAIVSVLRAADLPAVRTDGVEVLETPRVEVRAIVVKGDLHEVAIPTGAFAGRRVFDMFGLQVQVDLVATPTAGQPMGSLRGDLRAALFFIDPAAINSELAYLAVAVNSFRVSVGDRVVTGKDGSVRASATLPLVVGIRSDAYPA